MNILLDCNSYLECKIKPRYGLQHPAASDFDLKLEEDRYEKLYVKKYDNGRVYIWACNKKEKEINHWVETIEEFWYYFILVN